MVSIKKQRVRGYILLESLAGMATLVVIVSLVLSVCDHRQKVLHEQMQEAEALNLAIMAVQTGQDSLAMNGVTVTVDSSKEGITVRTEGRVILHVTKN